MKGVNGSVSLEVLHNENAPPYVAVGAGQYTRIPMVQSAEDRLRDNISDCLIGPTTGWRCEATRDTRAPAAKSSKRKAIQQPPI
jgi:hypothetical protein